MKQIMMIFFVMAFGAVLGKTGIIDSSPNRIVRIEKMTVLYEAGEHNRNVPVGIQSLAWSPYGKVLLVDYLGMNQYYSVAALQSVPNGFAKIKVLTSRRVPGNTRLNNGNPRWLPDGSGFVFCGQNRSTSEFKRAYPGYGLDCEVFFGSRRGDEFRQLTRHKRSEKFISGTSMPMLSSDGSVLYWTAVSIDRNDTVHWGTRRIMSASFSKVMGEPRIGTAVDITPDFLKDTFIETSDCRNGRLLYSASRSTASWYGMDVYVQNVANNGGITPDRLTDTPDTMDRFPVFSPAGKKIAWTSTNGFNITYLGVNGALWQNELRSELWLMDAGGLNKKQLTYFNTKGHEHYAGQRSYVGMIAWHPKYDNILAIVLNKQTTRFNVTSSVILVELGIEN